MFSFFYGILHTATIQNCTEKATAAQLCHADAMTKLSLDYFEDSKEMRAHLLAGTQLQTYVPSQ